MPRGYFVTGTDTGIGKTRIALALIEQLKQAGLRVQGMKPVAAGCERTGQGLRNEDAVQLQSASSRLAPYDLVNPCAYLEPVAPHLAAAHDDSPIEMEMILAAYQQLASSSDCMVVEGAGGWLVPLTAQTSIADLAQTLGLPVILVVGMRLGCLNHALLSSHAIQASGLPFAGWIANCMDPDMRYLDENIETLSRMLEIPLLATFYWDPDQNPADCPPIEKPHILND